MRMCLLSHCVSVQTDENQKFEFLQNIGMGFSFYYFNHDDYVSYRTYFACIPNWANPMFTRTIYWICTSCYTYKQRQNETLSGQRQMKPCMNTQVMKHIQSCILQTDRIHTGCGGALVLRRQQLWRLLVLLLSTHQLPTMPLTAQSIYVCKSNVVLGITETTCIMDCVHTDYIIEHKIYI